MAFPSDVKKTLFSPAILSPKALFSRVFFLGLLVTVVVPATGHSQNLHRDQPMATLDAFNANQDWWGGFDGTVVDGRVNALTKYNGDWIAGGLFGLAGGVSGTKAVARWTGAQWASMTPPGLESVEALATYQGELYVGGDMLTGWGAPSNYIMKWNGSTWGAVGAGMNGEAMAFHVFGTDLIVGGEFTQAGGVPANHVARWDGSTWSAFGSGLPGPIHAIAEYGGQLVVGGAFDSPGGGPDGVAFWNGSDWKKMSGGMNGDVLAFAMFQGELIAGGTFTTAGGGSGPGFIARWDGGSWEPLGTGTSGWVGALTVHDGYLYAAGGFSAAGGVPAKKIARWDGSSWSAVDGGMTGAALSAVYALDSDVTEVVAGGVFGFADTEEALNLAAWNGTEWSGSMSNSGNGLGDQVYSLLSKDGVLIMGGDFLTAGGTPANRIVRWDTNSWTPYGAGMNGAVHALTLYNGNLVAGGSFTLADGAGANRIALWDGSQWNPLGSGLSGAVYSLAVYNGDLYAGGSFTNAGGILVNNIARWDGLAWHDLDGGVEHTPGLFASVKALALYDGVLVAGGEFEKAGGVPRRTVAAWNGTFWSSLGSGLWATTYIPQVRALTIWNGDLIAGGDFTQAGGVLGAQYLARWNGSGWAGLGTLTEAVNAVLDCNGTLVAAPEASVVYFDGSIWEPLGGGMNSSVNSLGEFGSYLFAAGDFSIAGSQSSQHLARWGAQQTGISDPAPMPVTMRAFPNPFRSRTSLVFELDKDGPVEVSVFDLQGRRISTLTSGLRTSGQHEVRWNGRDENGRPVASGMYYLLLNTRDQTGTQKIVRIP